MLLGGIALLWSVTACGPAPSPVTSTALPSRTEATSIAASTTSMPSPTPTFTPSPTPSPTPLGGGGRLAFAAYQDGNWDIYTVNPDGTDLQGLTDDPAVDRSPAWSPDGGRIAFASRRDHNWDIYVVEADGGQPVRLTDDSHYDGAPCWSPDGRKIAFESSRAGDLDIFVMDADGSHQVNLTPNEPAGDYGPAWSPDGRIIAFTSWRFQDKDIFVVVPDSGEVRQWTDSPINEEGPVWSPDGQRLAFLVQENWGQEIYVMDADSPPTEGGRARRLTWFTHDVAPAWSPDGQRLAFIWRRSNSDLMLSMSIEALEGDAVGESPLALTDLATLDWTLSWNSAALAGSMKATPEEGGRSLYEEKAPPLSEGQDHPYDFVQLPWEIDVPIHRLSDRVDDSFHALRARVKEESGRDFLGQLSEAFRPINLHSEASDYTSWHKAGRAIDSLFDFYDEGERVLEVAREDIGGETYWRLFLRCAQQDGSQGEPLRTHLWDFSGLARRRYPQEGGQLRAIPLGYYVDFTALAQEYGWERISATDRRDFSWKWHFKAVEYWHHQKRDDLTWYQAMLEVYSPQEVEHYFGWDRAMELDGKEFNLFMEGIPLPPAASKWLEVRP